MKPRPQHVVAAGLGTLVVAGAAVLVFGPIEPPAAGGGGGEPPAATTGSADVDEPTTAEAGATTDAEPEPPAPPPRARETLVEDDFSVRTGRWLEDETAGFRTVEYRRGGYRILLEEPQVMTFPVELEREVQALRIDVRVRELARGAETQLYGVLCGRSNDAYVAGIDSSRRVYEIWREVANQVTTLAEGTTDRNTIRPPPRWNRIRPECTRGTDDVIEVALSVKGEEIAASGAFATAPLDAFALVVWTDEGPVDVVFDDLVVTGG